MADELKIFDEYINQLMAEIESSDKYIREYENTIEQRAFNYGLNYALRLAKQMKSDRED